MKRHFIVCTQNNCESSSKQFSVSFLSICTHERIHNKKTFPTCSSIVIIKCFDGPKLNRIMRLADDSSRLMGRSSLRNCNCAAIITWILGHLSSFSRAQRGACSQDLNHLLTRFIGFTLRELLEWLSDAGLRRLDLLCER